MTKLFSAITHEDIGCDTVKLTPNSELIQGLRMRLCVPSTSLLPIATGPA